MSYTNQKIIDGAYSPFEPTPNPEKAAAMIREIIKGKTVYEIGGGEGEFAAAMAPYAKRVVSIEIDPALAAKAKGRGVETVNSSFEAVSLEPAEVIYSFLGFAGMYALTRKITEDGWRGTLVSHYYPMLENPAKPWEPDEIIHVNADGFRFPFLVYRIP